MRWLVYLEKTVMSHVSVQVIAPSLTDFSNRMHCEQLFDQAGIGQPMHEEELKRYPENARAVGEQKNVSEHPANGQTT